MEDARRREELVAALRREGSVHDDAIAGAFAVVPRHRFVPDASVRDAYADRAISIKSTDAETLASISQPSMIARMLELLRVEPGNRVLEIGTGSGYNAALLATLAGERGHVVSVEVEPDLAERARGILAACGYDTVEVVQGDGYAGYPAAAPYDRIVVTARSGDVSRAWWEQLADGGRIVVPLDVGLGGEYAVGFVRAGDELRSVGIVHCLFVPLRGHEEELEPARIFTRSRALRYGTRSRAVRGVVAVRTERASPDMLEHADVVVARPETTFGVTWD